MSSSVRFWVGCIVEVKGIAGTETTEELLQRALLKAPNLYPVHQVIQLTPDVSMWFASEYETAIVRMEEEDNGIDYEQCGAQWRKMK